MKLNGQTISGPNVEVIVIPRGTGNLIFKAQAVLDFKEFDKLCPPPKPKTKLLPGGKTIPDLNDPSYLAEVANQSKLRMAWLVIKSLEATETLEWDKVKINDPTTWNYEQELKDSGFTDIEIGRLVTGVFTANSLNEAKIEEARQSFLASQQVPPKG